jgi:uroporphyrinogen-III synthase
VLAVGPATAAIARDLGFVNVAESPGEGVDGLAAHIRASIAAEKGILLHATGTETAGDLSGSLKPFGYRLRTEHVYDTHPAETLSGALATELAAGLVSAAMFFSPRTAQLFTTLVAAASLSQACHTVTALALSDAIAKALSPLAFRRVLCARKATTDAMLELIASL